MRWLREFFTITDAEGTVHAPSAMWRVTAVLIVESVALVLVLYGIGRLWDAMP
ncbi:MAG: hypothetical protein U0Y82_07735 [Thermoleophilia bacterium]